MVRSSGFWVSSFGFSASFVGGHDVGADDAAVARGIFEHGGDDGGGSLGAALNRDQPLDGGRGQQRAIAQQNHDVAAQGREQVTAGRNGVARSQLLALEGEAHAARAQNRLDQFSLMTDHHRDALGLGLAGQTRQREAIVLRYFEDLSLDQTASAMQVATGTIKATLNHAIRNLRQWWSK